MRIKYNSPVVLTFTFICAAVLILSQTVFRGLNRTWFMVPGRGGFYAGNARCWVTLLTHVMGHANWTHLLANFSFILLIGPILEEYYGSLRLLFMMIVTALATGILNALLFSGSLMGASGVAFMMILLISFTNFSGKEIPLTFILVLVLYLGRELIHSFSSNTVSEFAHIVGGFCGCLFGFFRTPPGKPRAKRVD
ncbi:MAG: rhomboid family intramembrane serine protease [Treponema sp.]|jgi:membrane associated rhomboid family serine protease|nr:rhomboid family intramembrane serine protease [Treponema sp.]